MPRYDFRCPSCEWTFEEVLPFGSNECPTCPQCGKRSTEKLIAPPLGIHFHGSGFYKTDAQPPPQPSPCPLPSPASAEATADKKGEGILKEKKGV